MTIMVSGHGIAGLSAALAAANAGHDVALCGAAPATAPAGGIQLAPNGWQALDQLGLGDAAMQCATRLDHIIVRDLASGATVLTGYTHGILSFFDKATFIKDQGSF